MFLIVKIRPAPSFFPLPFQGVSNPNAGAAVFHHSRVSITLHHPIVLLPHSLLDARVFLITALKVGGKNDAKIDQETD